MILNIKKRLNLLRAGQHGFTLPEVLVTVFIFSIIFGATLMVLLSGQDIWAVNDTQIELQQSLRNAMVRIRSDLQQSSAASPGWAVSNNTGAPDEITFSPSAGGTGGSITWGASINYEVNSGILTRTQGSNAVVVARNINQFEIDWNGADPDLVEIYIEAEKNSQKGKTVTESMAFDVQLRN